jgi:hypothetical protein
MKWPRAKIWKTNIAAVLALTVLSLAGCSSTKDVSSDPQFQKIVAKPLVLTQTWYAEPPMGNDGPYSDRYILVDEKGHNVKSTIINMLGQQKDRDASNDIRLPAGSTIQIDQVQAIWGFDSGAITYAIGHFISPVDSKPVKFFMSYGNEDDTRPAPWE